MTEQKDRNHLKMIMTIVPVVKQQKTQVVVRNATKKSKEKEAHHEEIKIQKLLNTNNKGMMRKINKAKHLSPEQMHQG